MGRKFLQNPVLAGDASAALEAVPKQQLDAHSHTHPLVPNPPVTLTYAANITPDASLGNYRVCTMTGAAELEIPTNGVDGQVLSIRFIASGAQRVLTFDALYKRPSHIPLTLTIASGGRGDTILRFENGYGWTVLGAQAVA